MHEDDLSRVVKGIGRSSTGSTASTDSAEVQRSVEWGLVNVYTIARRRLNRCAASEREWWEHVIRIAEESGVKSEGVLRRSVPTEIIGG